MEKNSIAIGTGVAGAESQLDLASRRILLVEDHGPNALVATSMFELLGYACDVAADGAEALKRFEDGSYALILMDLQMPVMDGLETTKRIRAMEHDRDLRHTPILAMTAHVSDTDRIKCAEAGMNGFIPKPFNPETMATMLEDFMPPAPLL